MPLCPQCLSVFFLAFHFRRKFKSEETQGDPLEYSLELMIL